MVKPQHAVTFLQGALSSTLLFRISHAPYAAATMSAWTASSAASVERPFVMHPSQNVPIALREGGEAGRGVG